ncbi:MAG TPA: 50S ribosomal protein L31 [Candidatus Bathyarchaeia archaeon]|nr:50S ribosomal protein L31 [Candidatus Bathyarchaeia archaeon]
MKKDIHPKYHPNAKVTCACGAQFTTGSTKPEIQVDICCACHPFFTGEMKFVDTLGRVDRFLTQRQKAQKSIFVKKKVRRQQKRKTEEKVGDEKSKTLKEMLKKPAR